MCAKVNKYESKTQKLQQVIYPQVLELLDEIKCYINIHNYEGLEEHIDLLLAEFNSLISLENKLVFPVILSVFKEDFDFTYFPNIAEIVHLTSAKDAKIKIYLSNIESIVAIEHNIPKDDFEKDIQSLLHLFKETYYPVKKRWNALLQMLSKESVQCDNRNKGTCKCDAHAATPHHHTHAHHDKH